MAASGILCHKAWDIKPFHANGFYLYPLQKSENLWFLKFSGGTEINYEMGWELQPKQTTKRTALQ